MAEYFARAPTQEIAAKIKAKLTEWTQKGRYAELRDWWRTAYYYLHGIDFGTGQTNKARRDGYQGEIVRYRVNGARAFQKSKAAMTINQPVSWKPVPRTSDAAAYTAVDVFTELLTQYWEKHGLAAVDALNVDFAIGYGEGHVYYPWDPLEGAPVAMGAKGVQVPEGNLTFQALAPWDVFRDPSARSYKVAKLCRIVRTWWNKYELAARQEQLLQLGIATTQTSPEDICKYNYDPMSMTEDFWRDVDADTDVIPVYSMWHEHSAVIPGGRHVEYIDDKLCLHDSAASPRGYGYKKAPISRMVLDEWHGSPYGYTPFWDTLGAQEIADWTFSAMGTNMTMSAIPTVVIKKGTSISSSKISPMRVMYVDDISKDMPQEFHPANTPPEAFNLAEMIRGRQQEIMGLNDVAMGRQQGKELNAQAFALLYSMAAQANTPVSKNRVECLTETGQGVLDILQANLSVARKISMAGKDNKSAIEMQEFTGDTLKVLEQVKVEVSDPLESNVAGKMALMEKFIELGFVATPERLMELAEKGRLKTELDGELKEIQYLNWCKEQLREGIVPPLPPFAKFDVFIREANSVLMDPVLLQNPSVVNSVQTFLADCLTAQSEAAMTMPEVLAAVGGGMPMDPAAMMGAPPVDAPPEAPADVTTNPVTGAPFDLATGGMGGGAVE